MIHLIFGSHPALSGYPFYVDEVRFVSGEGYRVLHAGRGRQIEEICPL